MITDPQMWWDGPHPYEVLARAGLGPASSHLDVIGASLTLMAEGPMTPTTRAAWEQLRDVRRRLLVDLFSYDVDLPGDVSGDRDAIVDRLATGPPPVDVEPLVRAELRTRCRDLAGTAPAPDLPVPALARLAQEAS